MGLKRVRKLKPYPKTNPQITKQRYKGDKQLFLELKKHFSFFPENLHFSINSLSVLPVVAKELYKKHKISPEKYRFFLKLNLDLFKKKVESFFLFQEKYLEELKSCVDYEKKFSLVLWKLMRRTKNPLLKEIYEKIKNAKTQKERINFIEKAEAYLLFYKKLFDKEYSLVVKELSHNGFL